jgi:excisionase family DNA binding protein
LLQCRRERLRREPVTSGVTGAEWLRPSVHRDSEGVLTLRKEGSGEGPSTLQTSPTAPSAPAVTHSFAALVLQGVKESKDSSQIVATLEQSLLLSVRAVADLLGVSRATVYKLVADGRIRSIRVGNAIRIRANDLSAL